MNVLGDERARGLGVAGHALAEHARDLERVLVVEAGLAVQRAELGRLEVGLAVDALVGVGDRQPERAPAGGQEARARRRCCSAISRAV